MTSDRQRFGGDMTLYLNVARYQDCIKPSLTLDPTRLAIMLALVLKRQINFKSVIDQSKSPLPPQPCQSLTCNRHDSPNLPSVHANPDSENWADHARFMRGGG